MAKTDSVRRASSACADSRELIDQSAVLISGSSVACAVHLDQIAKSKAIVAKSRAQIALFRAK